MHEYEYIYIYTYVHIYAHKCYKLSFCVLHTALSESGRVEKPRPCLILAFAKCVSFSVAIIAGSLAGLRCVLLLVPQLPYVYIHTTLEALL